MSASTGYYSIIQYCPDPSRMEAANVGVALLCPELGYLRARIARGNDRIRRFFGAKDLDKERLKALKQSIEHRLLVEADRIRTREDLEHFADTRANAMRLTPPRMVRVEFPDETMRELFDRLVGGRVQKGPARVTNVLDQAFQAEPFLPLIRRKVTVTVPNFNQQVQVPYGFKNGRFNLIQPVQFRVARPLDLMGRAGKYAFEGNLLYRGPADPEFGQLQLIVVGHFGSSSQELAKAQEVRRILRDNNTDFYRLDEINKLLEHIRTTAKPVTAGGPTP